MVQLCLTESKRDASDAASGSSSDTSHEWFARVMSSSPIFNDAKPASDWAKSGFQNFQLAANLLESLQPYGIQLQ